MFWGVYMGFRVCRVGDGDLKKIDYAVETFLVVYVNIQRLLVMLLMQTKTSTRNFS